MKFRIAVIAALAMALFVFAGRTASAQQTIVNVTITPDERFTGYPRSLIQWPSAQPDLEACQDQEFYEPLDTHLMKYVNRVQVKGERVQEHDECTWMLTRNKWRYVLRPKGTKVAIDAQGRDLFDFGSPAGKKCANPRPVSVPITPPASVPPPAPPKVEEEVPKPVPAPIAPACSITGDRLSGFIGVATDGTGSWWFDGIEQEITGNRFSPPAIIKPGVHTVEFRVSGLGGQITCEWKFDLFAPLTPTIAVTPKPRPEPKVEKPSRRKLWIVVGIVGAAAVGGGVYAATRGGEKRPAVGGKPGVTTISPP